MSVNEIKTCSTCNESWAVYPSAHDLRMGDDLREYCCCKNARVVVQGQAFPRLCSLVRGDRNLCGPKAVWWTPIVEPLQIGGFTPRKERDRSRLHSRANERRHLYVANVTPTSTERIPSDSEANQSNTPKEARGFYKVNST